MKLRLWTIVVALILAVYPAIAQRYYAVLITGDKPNITPDWMPPNGQQQTPNGITEENADDSYWNDTYMMWKTLVDNGWDLDKIKVLYYNGLDYDSQNPNYHHEGGITNQAASLSNIQSVFANLASTLNNNDVLLVWTFDHGDQDYAHPGRSALLVYKDPAPLEYLWDETFAAWVNAIPCRKRIVLMGQCNSGGFIDNLQGTGIPTFALTATDFQYLAYKADDDNPDSESEPKENEYYGERQWYHGEFYYHVLNALPSLPILMRQNSVS
jgi:hypothetical protein